MGVYLVSIEAREWFGESEEAGGHGAVASAFDDELRRRGLPPYEPGPGSGDGGGWFEEKVSPSMKGFDAFCRAHLTGAERETLYGWTVLVPLSLEEPIPLPIGSAYTDETLIAGAPQVLALGERLAAVLGLPLDAIPATGANLELSLWFMEDQVRRTAAARPGPWAEDLDTAFYVAVYLRAAQYALRHGCPITYS
ncbi:hypothetical protein NFX46_13985 [Streptomyces phaeoluteigriseus]|uniref:Uncharacterized protein n=1 Tax=Streptomyces phaeoluteigriseus TaxID=114686 RepID=A0ABY4Z761_9ACTN|nr:hypothetical protein [Streptomyces phaeoluteigriseus]USQ84805.1 hypothetical protein NFX46_13985 [Streptomyces phaeoluteigriseus]